MSGPVDFLGFVFCRSCLMPSFSTFISSISEYGVQKGLVIRLSSSCVEVVWYWRFSMMALSLRALHIRPLSFNCDLPA